MKKLTLALLCACLSVFTAFAQCTPQQLPYTENFDNMTSMSCFLTSNAQLSTTYSVTSGGKSVKLSTTTSTGAYIVLPAVVANANTLECIFQVRGVSSDVAFYAGVVTDTSNIVDYFEPTYAGIITGGINDWQEIEFNTSSCSSSASPTFLCIYINDGVNGAVYLDNIDVHTLPTCLRPASVTVTGSGMNDVTFGWTPTGTESQWSLTYQIMQAGTPVASAHVTTNQPSYTVTGLNNSTAYTYNVSVRALCGTTDSSVARTGSGSFSTSCQIVSSFPYIEDFEASVFPSTCQNFFNPYNDPTGTYVTFTRSTSKKHGGTYSMYASDGQTGNIPSLALPQMNLTDPNGYTVKFWVYRHDYYPAWKPDEGYKISISATNSTLTGATELGFIPAGYSLAPAESSAGWYQYEFEVPASYSGLYYIILSYVNDYNQPGYYDDVTVAVKAGCGGMSASSENVTATTADIVSSNASITNWQVMYWENVAANTPVLMTSTSARQTLTGLTPNTQYAYYVRRICGAGDTSAWSSIKTFTTDLMADTLPFITGFETTDNNDWLITNQSYNAFVIGSDANAVYSGSQALYVSNDGSTYGYGTGYCQAFASKLLHFDETDYNISFKYKCTGGEINIDSTSIYDFGRVFLVPGSTEINGGNSSSLGAYASYDNVWPAGLIPLDPENHPYICHVTGDANGWNTINVPVNMIGRSGNYKFVVMWSNDYSSGSQYPLAIDELAITLVSCPRPNVGISQLTSNSANVAASGAASYRVLVSSQPIDIYGTISADIMDTVVTGPVDVTGLTPNTTYYYTALGFCLNGDTSEWRNVQSFTTECISSVPYTESFEQAGVLDCWSYAGDNALTISKTRAHAGVKSLYINNVYAISPEMDIDSISKYTLNGWVYAETADVLNIGVVVDPTDGSTFENVASFNLPAGRWTEFSTLFTLLDDPEYSDFATARHFTLSSQNGTAFNADNLFFGIVPQCPRPVDPVISDTVHNGFQMTWTDSLASMWIVRIVPTAGGDTVTITTDTTYVNVTSLNEQTQYSVDVAAVCGEDFYSLFVPCGVITTPVYVPTCPDPAAAPVVNATTASTMTVTANGQYISYEFAYATSNSTSAFIGIIPSATNRVILTGLTSNSTYYVWFRGACEPGDTSRWSAVASGTTTYSDFFMPQNPHVVGVAEATSTTIAWGGCPDADKYAYELVNNATGEVLTDTVLFSNLTPATTYTFRVCAIDTVTPDTTAWTSLTFKTIANATTTPYFCDFEDSTENASWMFVNDSQTNQFMIGTTDDFDGTLTNALFVSGDGSTNAYTSTPSTVYAMRALNLNAGNYRFNYNWVCAGEPSVNPGLANDYPRIFLAPASMQFTAGTVADGIGYGFTDVPVGCIALDSGYHLTQALSSRFVSGSFALANAGIYNIVVFWTNDNSLQRDPSITVDSIRFSQVIDGDTYTDTICYGEDYNDHGFNVPASQLYVGMNNLSRIASGAAGCPDTIFRANVTMRAEIKVVIYDTICSGENYNDHGYSLVNPGSGYYPHTGDISVTGCDSSTHLYLHVVPTSSVQNETTCKGTPFVWHGSSYTAAGTYTYSGLSSQGCTVNDTLHLSIIDGDMTYSTQMCNGGSVVIGDTTVTTAGTYVHRFFDNTIGCYVTYTVTVTVVNQKVENIHDYACEGHPYTNYNQNIPVVTQDTTITVYGKSVEGCDSTTFIYLDFTPTVTSDFDDTIPASGVYYWGGQSLTQPGDYPLTMSSIVTGCDSVVTLHLHSVTGVETVSDVRIDVVPNPVTIGATALVYGNFGDINSVQILNSVGQVIDTFVPASYPIEVNGISAAGIYYVRLITTTGDVHIQKLIVK